MDDKRSPAHGDRQEKVNAMRKIDGEVKEKATNQHKFFSVDNKTEGTNAMEYVTKGAVLEQEIHGGSSMMVVGGGDLSLSFERTFFNETSPATDLGAYHDVEGSAAAVSEPLGAAKIKKKDKSASMPKKHYATQEQFISRSAGGQIELCGCSIAFPPGCMKRDAFKKIFVGRRVAPEFAERSIAITPSLGCELSHDELVSGFEVEVEVLAYCFATQPVPIVMLRNECGTKNWVIEKKMMLGRDRKLKFKTSKFSTIYFAVMRFLGLGQYLTFLVYSHLFCDDRGEVKFYASLENRAIVEEIKTENLENGFVSGLIKPELMTAKLEESIGVELQCIDPPTTNFGKKHSSSYKSDELIDKRYVRRDFELKNIPENLVKTPIKVLLTMKRPNCDPYEQNAQFRWKVQSEKDLEESARKQPTVNVSMNVGDSTVVAKNYAASQAHLECAETSSHSNISNQTAEQAERIIRAAKGSRIGIKIFGDDLEDVFEQDFKPEKTIYEIIRKLKKTEKRPAGEKLILKLKKKNEKYVILEDETTVGELGKDVDTVILWAEFPGSK